MADQNAIIPVTPSVPKPPNSQIGATANPQTVPKPTLSQSGYKPSAQAPTKGNAPITQEGGYYQSRATDLGLMEQSPKQAKLPEMSVSLGGSSSPSYGTGGIFKTPNSSSYQSGTSLANGIPNIMADNNVQSAIGSVTQPVSTGLMRGVPKMPAAPQPIQNVDLWDDTSVLDNI